ncbi:MAG TPA: isopenicillin N synthase family oxygenase [Aeromonadales bacterium]|nr:isopenicillin N synthase family oxygenase [Aeromonadales bacterium]
MTDKQKQGVHAVSQDFKAYEQVEKNQNYHLAETPDADEFDEDFVIQTLDMSGLLSGDKQAGNLFAQQLGKAMEEIGFVILTGHGVDTALYEEAQVKIKQFFETISEQQKLNYLAQREGSVNQGYFPIKQTTIIHPDLVQGWVFCRRAFNMDNDSDYQEDKFWPEKHYEAFFRKICQAHEKLVLPIMQSILHYFDCDKTLYDEKLTRANFGFRLNYYPPLNDEDISSGAGRMLGHEDVDLFTLLPAQDLDGLQVLNRKNMKWVKLKAPQGSIVMNTGDYMQRITNDRLPSTTHRVSSPRDESRMRKCRISFPMAIYIRENEYLEVLPGLENPHYPPIKAIDFHTRITSKYYGDDYAIRQEK